MRRSTVPSLHDLPGWLDGRWEVERVINDGEGRFTGDAVFQSKGGGDAVWRETGRLVLAGFDGPVYRTLLLAPAAHHHGAWQVRFDDGRPFHPLDLRTGRWEAEHLCGPDVYRGRFAVIGHERMTICWQVTGPGRGDAIVTEYRRSD